MQLGGSFLIHFVFAVVATAMAIVEIVLAQFVLAAKNIINVFPVFRGASDLEGVKIMACFRSRREVCGQVC